MASKSDLEASIKQLLPLSDSELETELGRRLVETRKELERDADLTVIRAAGGTVDREALQGVPDFARAVADDFLKRFNRQMYSLVCDQKDPDHSTIRTAAGQGLEALGYAISGALVASFGWLPGIAAVIAVIIARRAVKAGYESFCGEWQKRL